MKPGDIIRSHVDIPTIPVEPKEGDAYPIGALPVGTIISQFEIRPGQGAMYCRSAGASAVVLRRGKNVGLKSIEELTAASTVSNDDNDDLEDDDVVFVRRNGNSKVYRLLPACMCVVGQVSNHHHDQFK
ncbi:unnamed protein product [Trichobilharzia regenti]|nr:unnamed protein product [Trichobilharzia regenti]